MTKKVKTRIPLEKNVEVSVEVVDDWMPKFDNDHIEPIDSEPITYYNVRIRINMLIDKSAENTSFHSR